MYRLKYALRNDLPGFSEVSNIEYMCIEIGFL